MNDIEKGADYIKKRSENNLNCLELLKDRFNLESEKEEKFTRFYEFNIKFATLVKELNTENTRLKNTLTQFFLEHPELKSKFTAIYKKQ